MVITNEEFQKMADELLNPEKAKFDTLCVIAKKVLEGRVKRLCVNSDLLRGGNHEEDIMNCIYLRLMKTVKTDFLYHEKRVGDINFDPEGFRKWLYTVAANEVCNYTRMLNKTRRDPYEVLPYDFYIMAKSGEGEDDTITREIVIADDGYTDIETKSQLQHVFDKALKISANPYKILTWLMSFVIQLVTKCNKIEANKIIINLYENSTLGLIYDEVIFYTDLLPWLTFSDKQKEFLWDKLRKVCKNGIPYYAAVYSWFYMKKGRTETLSDWINRINAAIKEDIRDEAP